MIRKILVQRAEASQERSYAVLVLGTDRLGQQVLVHRLCRQLRNIAACVVHHPAVQLGRAVEGMLVLHQRRAIVVAQHLQRHAEYAAVRQDAFVVMWKPRGARIEIEVLVAIPGDVLRAADLRYRVAGAQRPVAAAGTRSRLQDQRMVACVAQFVSQHHAGDPGADDDHAPAASGRQLRRPGIGRGTASSPIAAMV